MKDKRPIKQVIVEDIFNSVYDPTESFEKFIASKSAEGKPDPLQMIRMVTLLVSRVSEIERFLKSN